LPKIKAEVNVKTLLVVLLAILSLFSFTAAAEETDSVEATVVFIRWSMVGAIRKASVYDVTDGRLEFIGLLTSKSRVSHKVSPGKHTFMVVSEAADFMQAEVAGGRVYYAAITPRAGVVQDRFSMYPFRKDKTSRYNTETSDFRKWMENTDEAHVSDSDLDWFEDNRPYVERLQDKYWDDWLEKSPAERAEHTLNPEDGVDQ
jgi:hypothetical protein